MKNLLSKIRSATPDEKCQLATEVHGHVTMVLQNLEKQLDQIAPTDLSTSDISTLDQPLDEMEAVLNELENLLNSLDSKEITRIHQNIEKDYKETIEIWKFYEILNPDGKTYTADYDGRAGAGRHGKNSPAGTDFTGQKFKIPTLQEVLSCLKPADMKLYRQMEKEGLQPKLQITPIAFNIRTLGQKIDSKMSTLKINATRIREEINDNELQYAPTNIKAINGGREIEIIGGQSKSDWIKQNQGFLVDLIPTKQILDINTATQKPLAGSHDFYAAQAEKNATKAKEAGYTPMSYESYLLAQMRALKAKKPLDEMSVTLLLCSNSKNRQNLACGFWNGEQVSLGMDLTMNRTSRLYLRPSVRLKF